MLSIMALKRKNRKNLNSNNNNNDYKLILPVFFMNKPNFKDHSDALIEELKFQGINDKKVLNALKKIKRHLFVPLQYKDQAYENIALPLDHESTISQPYTVAFMLQNLKLKKGFKVLEIGTGSGWNASLISSIIGFKGKVYTTEINPEIVRLAERNIKKVNIKNIMVIYDKENNVLNDSYFKKEKFDRIIVTAAAKEIPKKLIKILKNNGVLLCPVGKEVQNMIKITKKGKKLIKENLGEFIFVRLR